MEGRLGFADDEGAPTGAFSFRAAITAALEWARQQHAVLEARGEASTTRDQTVRTAIETYSTARSKKSKSSGKNATGRLAGYVLTDKAFAETKLAKLRASTIEAWRDRLPMRAGDDPNAVGIAPSTVNRLLNDLRAALNAAAERHRRELPAHVAAEIKVGTRRLSVESGATMQLLSDDEVRRVTAAAFEVDEDFGSLVMVAAATGARFSQLAALKVSAVQIKQGRIMIGSSKKGRATKARPPIAIPLSPDVLQRLRPAVEGRPANAALFLRWSFRRGRRLEWLRDKRVPWAGAYQVEKPWAASVARAELPAGTIMYALRHSSIVRGLTAGLPVRLVAAAHDTSVAMIEAHYSAFIVEVTEDLARRAAISLAAPTAVLAHTE